VLVEPTPHPSEFVADAALALSTRGEGAATGSAAEEKKFGEEIARCREDTKS
jgi:hypothetical protein